MLFYTENEEYEQMLSIISVTTISHSSLINEWSQIFIYNNDLILVNIPYYTLNTLHQNPMYTFAKQAIVTLLSFS